MLALLIVLIGWNAFLTYEIDQMNHPLPEQSSPQITVEETTVHGFSTDLTEVVDQTEAGVVSVLGLRGSLFLGSGSGVIYSSNQEEVLILTNAHFLDGANTIRVIFDNGSVQEAELIGTDEPSDVVLLRVFPDFNVDPLIHGDSSLLKNGEWVLAVGSARGAGLQGSVSVGVISSSQQEVAVDLDKDGQDDWQMLVMKTDARINSGNTGGPLVNLQGELVGLVSRMQEDEKNEGLFQVVPINELTILAEKLQEQGTVYRPDLGISVLAVEGLTVYQKSYLGLSLDTVEGLYIRTVREDSAASRAGLMSGDILIQIQQTVVSDQTQYRRQLYDLLPQEEIELTVLRNGSEMKVTVVLE